VKLRAQLTITTIAVSLPMIAGLVVWDDGSRQRAAEDELAAFGQGLASSARWRARCEASPETWRGRPEGPPGHPGRPPDEHSDQPPHERGDQPPHERGDRPPHKRGDRPPHERGDRPPHERGAGRPPDGLTGRPPDESGAGPPPGGHGTDHPPHGRGGPPGPPPRGQHRRPAAFFAYDAKLASPHPEAPALPASLAVIADGYVSLPADRGLVRVLFRVPGGERCAFVLAEGTTEPWLGGVLPPTQAWLLPFAALLIAVVLTSAPLVGRIRRLTTGVEASVASGYVTGVPTEGNDELANLARAFDGAAREVRHQLERAEHREQALRDFVANTTHDVMIPLTVLQGHLAELDQQTSVGDAMAEAHYLGALIQNLSLAAKLDAVEPEPLAEPVDLAALVERVYNRHRPVARSRSVRIDRAVPPEPTAVLGDVTMLEQAVSNVVHNAVRYNTAGGHVAIVLERDHDRFTLSVVDDGPGIPPHERERLLERGYRTTDARTRSPEGHGIGLDITQRVIAKHELELELDAAEEERGLRVTVAGPLAT
jgi:two-component system sensor histidine kinase BaeS